jgi:hypothetical protein
MSIQNVFEDYLNFRFTKAGAVTPGQKLEVVRQVRADAERGQVPIDANSVASLDISDPNVQAVLRGESVSMGTGTAPKRRKASASNLGGDNENRRKMLLFLLVSFGPILLAFIFLFFRGKSRTAAAEAEVLAANAATETVVAEASLTEIPVTMTAEAVSTQLADAEMQPTLVIPTPTADGVLYAPVAGDAAQKLTNPASIEIGGRLFILQQGEVDRKTGLWNPEQPEWLEETELRKVFALPRSYLENAGIVPGTHALVRLRNGELIDFVITTILRIPMNQIEVLSSNRPSLVILTIDELAGGQDPQLERLVIVGEVPVPEQPEALMEPQPLTATIRSGVEGEGARLRKEPSLSSEVLDLLPVDTVISVPFPLQRQEEDDLIWVFVYTTNGSGWLAEDLIIYRP